MGPGRTDQASLQRRSVRQVRRPLRPQRSKLRRRRQVVAVRAALDRGTSSGHEQWARSTPPQHAPRHHRRKRVSRIVGDVQYSYSRGCLRAQGGSRAANRRNLGQTTNVQPAYPALTRHVTQHVPYFSGCIVICARRQLPPRRPVAAWVVPPRRRRLGPRPGVRSRSPHNRTASANIQPGMQTDALRVPTSIPRARCRLPPGRLLPHEPPITWTCA